MSTRSVFRRIAATIALLATATAPAYAQSSAAAPMNDQGPSLLWLWVWILVAGIIIFVVGTSMGMSRGGRR